MPAKISESFVVETISQAQARARDEHTITVTVDGEQKEVRSPYPSPIEWRDQWIYFLLLDRFNNPSSPPRDTWNRRYDFRQGGNFKGVQAKLGYLERLGVKAIWISPVLKNARPSEWRYNYHGYGQQDFLNLDERFASDGTLPTAERELAELVQEAHARGMFVILDIVLNHTARVFDYVRLNGVVSQFSDSTAMNGALGTEPSIQWLNGFGFPRADWQDANLPDPKQLHPDDAVWPADLQNYLFFRRRGSKLNDDPDQFGFVRGDFGDMRQLVVEYDATQPGQEQLRQKYGIAPVLSILIRAHQYLMARYDFDGFRIDTVKYVHPEAIETFGNAMREFAITLGKKNFFTFAEVYDNEVTIAKFTGRNGGGEGFGVDAALDFPLFYKLPGAAKGFVDVREIHRVFLERKAQEIELLSSHGEAGRFFVSFLDNHDQKERIQHPNTPPEQVKMALALLFCLQGIPCLYYGTEQSLSGTVTADGKPDLSANESSREALWGKPNAFDETSERFQAIKALSDLRAQEPPLTCGRLYFREVSQNGQDFGMSYGRGGLVAFSRILVDREIVIVANTGNTTFSGSVIVDRDIHATPRTMKVAYSNVGTVRQATTRNIGTAKFYQDGNFSVGPAAVLDVSLAPMEVQICVPV